MHTHLAQVKHNEEFLSVIEGHCPEDYFDWKIIVVFYAGLHYLRALEKLNNVEIGGTHGDLFYHINPYKTGRLMPIDVDIYNAYSALYNLSTSSRYDGIDDKEQHKRAQQYCLVLAKDYYYIVKGYCMDQGVTV
jgi:hypothetical protein